MKLNIALLACIVVACHGTLATIATDDSNPTTDNTFTDWTIDSRSDQKVESQPTLDGDDKDVNGEDPQQITPWPLIQHDSRALRIPAGWAGEWTFAAGKFITVTLATLVAEQMYQHYGKEPVEAGLQQFDEWMGWCSTSKDICLMPASHAGITHADLIAASKGMAAACKRSSALSARPLAPEALHHKLGIDKASTKPHMCGAGVFTAADGTTICLGPFKTPEACARYAHHIRVQQAALAATLAESEEPVREV